MKARIRRWDTFDDFANLDHPRLLGEGPRKSIVGLIREDRPGQAPASWHSALYCLVRHVVELVRVRRLDDVAKDAEILVLRHQLVVLRKSYGGRVVVDSQARPTSRPPRGLASRAKDRPMATGRPVPGRLRRTPRKDAA